MITKDRFVNSIMAAIARQTPKQRAKYARDMFKSGKKIVSTLYELHCALDNGIPPENIKMVIHDRNQV